MGEAGSRRADKEGLAIVSLTLPQMDRFRLNVKDLSRSELFTYGMIGWSGGEISITGGMLADTRQSARREVKVSHRLTDQTRSLLGTCQIYESFSLSLCHAGEGQGTRSDSHLELRFEVKPVFLIRRQR